MPRPADAGRRVTGSLLLSVAFLVLIPAARAWASGTHSAADEHPLGVLHPLVIHFPLALTSVAALAVLLGLVFKGRFFRDATTFSITLAALAALPAWWLGGEAAASMGRMSEGRAAVIGLHETWGTIAAVTIGVAAVLHGLWRRWPKATALGILSRLSILAAAGVVAATGYLGAEVVRGPNHLERLLPF